MDIGHVEGRFALLVALAPCIIGYGLVAKRIEKEMPDEAARTDGPCSYWLQYYLSDAYQQIVRDFRRVIEDLAPEQSPSQVEHLVRVFARSCEVRIFAD